MHQKWKTASSDVGSLFLLAGLSNFQVFIEEFLRRMTATVIGQTPAPVRDREPMSVTNVGLSCLVSGISHFSSFSVMDNLGQISLVGHIPVALYISPNSRILGVNSCD